MGNREQGIEKPGWTSEGWLLHRQTSATLAELAKQCNPAIRGWWNYYGAFYRTAMHKLFRYIDQRLEQWARRKYQTLLRRKRRSVDWLRRMKNASPTLFYRWSVVGEKVGSWEPCKSRDLRTVLPEAQGVIPWAYSPAGQERGRTTAVNLCRPLGFRFGPRAPKGSSVRLAGGSRPTPSAARRPHNGDSGSHAPRTGIRGSGHSDSSMTSIADTVA